MTRGWDRIAVAQKVRANSNVCITVAAGTDKSVKPCWAGIFGLRSHSTKPSEAPPVRLYGTALKS